MINPREWMTQLLPELQKTFGARLRYLGLQGSYRRGEATEASDIDVVVLLDSVDLADLDAYAGIVRTLPEGHKACGFICAEDVFAAWPRHELFPFSMDTEDHFGKLADFLPSITKDNIREGAKISASALVHMLTHSYLYAEAENRPAILKEAFKAAFFLMQVSHYLATGTYCRSKEELLQSVDGDEKEIISAGRDFSAWRAGRSEKESFALLLDWCRGVMLRR